MRFGSLAPAIMTILSVVVACSSTNRTNEYVSQCKVTPIQAVDLETFGFTPAPQKVVVMRVFATWCPYCKSDLDQMAAKFQAHAWTTETVRVRLLAYRNHSENKSTLDKFVKEKLKNWNFPEGVVEVRYVDQPFADLAKFKTPSGQLLFEGWKGVPYALIFGKDQRLAYRGHFTASDESQTQQYKFIDQLTHENCGPKN